MPARSLRPCVHPGCGLLVTTGKCDQHRKAERQAQDRNRASAWKRGYDDTWRQLREQFLRAHPLCMCDECKAGELKVTLATVVDHIIPIEERPDLRLQWSNLRSMSKPHHDAHTARTRAFGKSKTGGGSL